LVLNAAAVPVGSSEREEMHIMNASATSRRMSGAQQQAVPGFAAALASRPCLDLPLCLSLRWITARTVGASF